jgi:uncharacterized protein (TIRG00374 family)
MTLDSEAVSAPTAATAATAAATTGRTLLLRMAIGLGVGAIFAMIFLQLIDLRSVAARLEHLNFGFALLCGAVFLSAYAVRALRWRWFLAPDKVPAARAIRIYFIATFLNWALPVQGGELAKSLMLRRSNGIPVNRSLATVTMDKAMDLLPAVVLLILVPVAGLQLSGPIWGLLAFALVILALSGLALGFANWQRDRTLALMSRLVRAILPKRVGERVEPFVMGFVDTLLTLFRKPRLLVIAAAYTVVAVALDALFCYLAFRAVGVSLSFSVVLYGYTFYNLAYILPTPPAHLGSNELIGLLVFSGMFGVSRSAVAAMFLFSHPWTGMLMTATALACLKAIGLDLRATLALRSGTEPMSDE